MSNHPDTRGLGPRTTASRRTMEPCEVCGKTLWFTEGEEISWWPCCSRCARAIAKARAYIKRLTPEQRQRYTWRTDIRERAAWRL